jgi:hypothetical protein
VFAGDKEKQIAVPGKNRKKWAFVLQAIESVGPWSRVEMLDGKGGLLAAVENTDPAGDLADLGAPTGTAAAVERMLVIVLKAQREAMAFRDSEVQGLLRAQADVLREQSVAVRSLTALYQQQVEAATELAAMRAEATPPPDQMQQLVEALPVIMQALPVLRSLLTGEASTPNGVKK